jgi:hypothetical protein
LRTSLLAALVLLCAACSGGTTTNTDGSSGNAGPVDLAAAGSADLATGGSAADLATASSSVDLATTIASGDMAVPASTISGVNCFSLGKTGCSGATPYGYYCFGATGPEAGCIAGSASSTFCCPDALCVSYTGANAACTAGGAPPNYFSCQPGTAPGGSCMAYGHPNGMDDYCCN